MFSLINGFQRFHNSHILLYHATFSKVPDHLKSGIHNVAPDMFYQQISWLKKHFDIVTVDDLVDSNVAGKAAITFDDAYLCVFKECLPVIESLKVPCTIFINGITLEGKPFWRDKIRYIINNKLTQKFIDFYKKLTGASTDFTPENFYRLTKKKVNSCNIDKALDEFLLANNIKTDDLVYCAKKGELVSSPFIFYGNHTYNHYVLSSLSEEEQENEIKENHQILLSYERVSKIFSIPFGGEKDFDEHTLRLIKKYGYKGFLYSRSRLNNPKAKQDGELISAERYMVTSSFNEFQKQIFKLFLRKILKNR